MNLGKTLKVILIVFGSLVVVMFFWFLFTPSPNPTADAPQRDPLVTVLSWLPMLILISVWWFFMSRYKSGIAAGLKHLDRSAQHMEAVEHKLDRITELLESRD